MRSNAFLSACLALGLVVLTISFFATKTSASPTNTQTMDIDEYNPFTSNKWPRHPGDIAPDIGFIQNLIDGMRTGWDLKATRTVPADHEEDIEDSVSVVTIGPAQFYSRAAMPTLMPPPPRPTTTITTVRKAGPTGWANKYGNNHGWAMVCYDQKDHTNYCYRSPRDYYCSSNGFLVRKETWPDGRYAPCEQYCRCTNINARPHCGLRWNDQTTCF